MEKKILAPSLDKTSEWFADEAFWRDCYPYLFQEERFAVAAEQVQQALTLIGFQGKTILDLCCGPGRHSVALAQRGLKVTGVDMSAFLLDKAQARAHSAGVKIEFIREDMRCFGRPEGFDGIINMYSSFGYFDDPCDDKLVLRNIYESLKPGGVFLIDAVGKEWISVFAEPFLSYEEPDGTIFTQRYEIMDNWKRQKTTWTLGKNGQTKTYTFLIRIYTGEELEQLMREAGFTEVRLYGDLQGMSTGQSGARLIAVGYKAKN